MTEPILSRDEAAVRFSVPAGTLVRYEEYGLIQAVRLGDVEGYSPVELRRLWTVVTCQRDLGINLAGVEAVLKLRDHLAEVHRRLAALAERLDDSIEAGQAPDA